VNNLNELFHQLADEGDLIRTPSHEEFFARIAICKRMVAQKKEVENWQLRIQRERDKLLGEISKALGIAAEDFPTFFDYLNDITDE
jgi:hypothetical protein